MAREIGYRHLTHILDTSGSKNSFLVHQIVFNSWFAEFESFNMLHVFNNIQYSANADRHIAAVQNSCTFETNWLRSTTSIQTIRCVAVVAAQRILNKLIKIECSSIFAFPILIWRRAYSLRFFLCYIQHLDANRERSIECMMSWWHCHCVDSKIDEHRTTSMPSVSSNFSIL